MVGQSVAGDGSIDPNTTQYMGGIEAVFSGELTGRGEQLGMMVGKNHARGSEAQVAPARGYGRSQPQDGGARYRTQVGRAYAPEHGATQANGRILPAVKGERANFADGPAIGY